MLFACRRDRDAMVFQHRAVWANREESRGCGSVGRASPCQGEGRGFESRHPLGRLAQRERASLTRKRSLVRSQYRPPDGPGACRSGPLSQIWTPGPTSDSRRCPPGSPWRWLGSWWCSISGPLPAGYYTRVGCHWPTFGGTPRKSGVRAVRTTPGQCNPTLVQYAPSATRLTKRAPSATRPSAPLSGKTTSDSHPGQPTPLVPQTP